MIGLAVLTVFVVLAALMYAGKIPALLALPLLALAVTLVAAFPNELTVLNGMLVSRLAHAASGAVRLAFGTVAAEGVGRLSTAIFTVLLGGVFGQYLKVTHTAESLVRRVAELAGDDPFSLGLIMTLAMSFLFTTLSGLGSVIMAANIFFPVMLSVGMPAMIAGCLMLFGLSLGGLLNLVNLAFYVDVLGMKVSDLLRFILPFALLNLVVLVLFMVVEFRRARLPLPRRSALHALFGGAVVLLLAAGAVKFATPEGWIWARRVFVGGVLAAMLLPERRRAAAALLTPFVPIGFVLFAGWPINAAFLVGILYLLRTAARRPDSPPPVRLLTQAVVEGLQGVAPAVGLMMGIGMVLVAVSQPVVEGALNPLLRLVLPTTTAGYLAFFILLAPLALYRGPLNLWGMGSGLMSLIQRTGMLTGQSIFVGFLSTGQIQGICDPTNTHNVWIATQLKLDVNAILKKTLPYVWATAAAGLFLGLALR